MARTREKRRIAGALRKGLAQAGFDQIEDPRDERGKRWKLPTLLGALVVGMAAGCKNLRETEAMTERLSSAMRRWLQLPGRIPDTTLRDVLCQLTPEQLRGALRRVVRAAHRRKALLPHGLPFGVASMDGKCVAIPACDDRYAQRQTQGEDGPLRGVVRTVTVALTSIAARPVIDVTAIPAATNEMGHYETALRALVHAYRGMDLFRLVTYDAGACSLHNATVTRELGLHYLFAITDSQPGLLAEMRHVLGERPSDTADAITEESVGAKTLARRVFLAQADVIAAPEGWTHLRTLVRVDCETRDDRTGQSEVETRYFVSSLPLSRLTSAQWLLVVRQHWGVELCHQTLDVALLEDDKPWITQNPRATAVVAVLRRITYTLLTLFRSVTQRSDLRRNLPWKELLRAIDITLLTLTESDLEGMREHRLPAPS
jgi:hypothetical protein